MMKDLDRKVFYVHGGTDTQTREDIRAITEKENDAIIVASYGTFSTGINIRNLHNIVFSSSKSRIRFCSQSEEGCELEIVKIPLPYSTSVMTLPTSQEGTSP